MISGLVLHYEVMENELEFNNGTGPYAGYETDSPDGNVPALVSVPELESLLGLIETNALRFLKVAEIEASKTTTSGLDAAQKMKMAFFTLETGEAIDRTELHKRNLYHLGGYPAVDEVRAWKQRILDYYAHDMCGLAQAVFDLFLETLQKNLELQKKIRGSVGRVEAGQEKLAATKRGGQQKTAEEEVGNTGIRT